MLQYASVLNDNVSSEVISLYMEASTERGLLWESGGSYVREESESPSTEDTTIVWEGISVNDGGGSWGGWWVDWSKLNYYWAFDTSTVAEGVINELNLRLVSIEIDDCLDHKTRGAERQRVSRASTELKRGEEVSDMVTILVEGRIKYEERDIERKEKDRTRSDVVGVAIQKNIVWTRRRIIVIEEEVKLLEERGVYLDDRHLRRVVGVNSDWAFTTEIVSSAS